jgi:hypothetical protein
MKKLITILLILVFVASIKATPLVYEGRLSTGNGGLAATGAWINGESPSILSWNIEKKIGYWHYQYRLEVPEKEISHFIIEVSDTFTDKDLFSETGNFEGWNIEDFWEENGNPGMPGTVYGLKFDETWGITLIIDFDTDRMPVWGDFYAKDGKSDGVFNAVWNSGFGIPDPQVRAHDGDEQGHLLVPDTYIPEPATVTIFGLGSLLLKKRR